MNHVHTRVRAQVHMGIRGIIAYALVTWLVVTCATVSQVFCEEAQDETMGIIIDALKREDESMRSMAIALVREMPGAEVTKALAKELPNLSAAGQVQLLSALADRGDRNCLPAVMTATKAKDESVRVAALKTVGDLGDASSVSMLAQAAASSSGAEQKAARESLYRLRGAKIDETILVSIIPAEPKLKVELISAVGERNIVAGVSTLLKTAKDEEAKVRRESFKVLKSIAEPKNLPALVELLIGVKNESERREAEKTVTAVAHKIVEKGQRAEAVLAKLPSVKDVPSRCSLLRVLGKIGDDSALGVLCTGLKDEEAKVKETCIRGLSEWPTGEPAAELLKVVQVSENKLHRVLALRGYVRLIGLESGRAVEETIGMYKQAMSLASDESEKKMVLSGLANIQSLAALQMASGYLEDTDLQQEAEVAVVKIASATSGSHPSESKAALQKVIQTTKNNFLREQAEEVINQLERFADYLTAWQVCGPYMKEGADGTQLFEVSFAPEKADAQDAAWRVMPAGTNKDAPWLMELDKALGGNNRAAYLRNKVWSPKEQKVQLELGSDDGIKVWLNGELVHANNATRPASPGQDKAQVTLKQGWNRLLLKLTQSGGEWAFCVRLRGLDGDKLEGLKVQLKE